MDDGAVDFEALETDSIRWGKLDRWDIIVVPEMEFAGVVVARPKDGLHRDITRVPVIDYRHALEHISGHLGRAESYNETDALGLLGGIVGCIGYERGDRKETVEVVNPSSRESASGE